MASVRGVASRPPPTWALRETCSLYVASQTAATANDTVYTGNSPSSSWKLVAGWSGLGGVEWFSVVSILVLPRSRCMPAATTPRPEHGHGSVLTAATAVLTGSPGPRDGGGRSDPAAVASRHVKGPVGVRALPRAVPERRRGPPDPHLGVRPRARGGQDRVRL